jgi:hypothetical protein
MARGVQNHAGGAYDAGAQSDIIQTDPLQGPIILLTGTADAINPYGVNAPSSSPLSSTNYMVNTGSADLMTLAAPVSGVDDGLSISIYSNTAFAHTLTSTGNFQTGGTATGVLTFAAHAGAGVLLRAYQGKWQIIGNNLVTLTS